MPNIKQEIQKLIQQCYSERKQKIFKSDIWSGQPPICQYNHNRNSSQYCDLYQHIDSILPQTYFPQSDYLYEHNSKRISVRNCHDYPFSAIGCVVYKSQGLTRYCTGTLIYNNMVLTSAVVCVNPITCKPTDSIYFSIGCCFDICHKKYEDVKVNQIRVSKIYYNKQIIGLKETQVHNQICVLELQDSIMKQCGYLGIMFANFDKPTQNKNQTQQKKQQDNKSMKVFMSGFGIHNTTYDKILSQSSVLVQQIEFDKKNEMIYHNLDSTYGYIGSPLFMHDQTNQKYYIIGIHSGRRQSITEQGKCKSARMITPFSIQFGQSIYRKKGVFRIQKQKINLSNTNQIQSKPFIDMELLAELSQQKLPYLQGLAIKSDNQHIKATGMKLLMESPWRTLLWIQLWQNQLGTNAMKYLSKCNWPHLSRLSLSDNKIQAQGLRHLSKSHWPSLAVLSLPSNLINSDGCHNLNLSYWPQLTIMALTQNRIDPISVHYIAKMATNFKPLSWLQLYENGVGTFSNSQLVQSLGNIYTKLYVYT